MVKFGHEVVTFPSESRENKPAYSTVWYGARKVDIRLPGKGNSNSHGARPVHLTITMIKWTRTSRLSIKKSLSGAGSRGVKLTRTRRRE